MWKIILIFFLLKKIFCYNILYLLHIFYKNYNIWILYYIAINHLCKIYKKLLPNKKINKGKYFQKLNNIYSIKKYWIYVYMIHTSSLYSQIKYTSPFKIYEVFL